MMYRRWAKGLAPAYRPTLADLWAVSEGLGDAPPVIVQQVRMR